MWSLIEVTEKCFMFFSRGHTDYDFRLYYSTWVKARNEFLTHVRYSNQEQYSSLRRVDGLAFTALNFSYDPIISLNHGCVM